MMTLRQIERYWQGKSYGRLVRELLSGRPEHSARLEAELVEAVPAAALAVVRLDELGQSHAFLCTLLIRRILSAQQPDGGWGDPMTTALCLRALLCAEGSGLAIEHGLRYLAGLQKNEGTWPRIPIRRTPSDAFVSAFILYQLGDCIRFREAVRFGDAMGWFEQHHATLDDDTAHLWQRAAFRCHLHHEPLPLWS